MSLSWSIQYPFFGMFSASFLSLSVYNLFVLGLSCSMWDLVPWAEIEPRPPPLGVWRLNHWTTRKIPQSPFFLFAFPRAGSKPSFRFPHHPSLLSHLLPPLSLLPALLLCLHLKWAPRWGPSRFDTIYFPWTIHPPTDLKMPKSVS